MNCLEAKQIPLVDYLETIGLKSVRKDNHGNHWYLSPLRSENDPSFRVNSRMNVWFDYALREGGTIIDLGIRLNKCNIESFLDILTNDSVKLSRIQSEKQIESTMKVLSVNNLVNSTLLNYLSVREITSNIAKKYCKEVYYEINGKKYFAIGFPNRSGGYELRNPLFKGCVSPKDISIFSEKQPVVCLFEGFMDFLSFFMLKIEVPLNTDYVILNSVAFLQKSLDILINYEKCYVFLDNDKSGQGAFLGLQLSLGKERVIDMSRKIYADHKDLNDYLISLTKRMDNTRSNGLRMSM